MYQLIIIKLFSTVVLPILTYGCEIWGPIILYIFYVNESRLTCIILDYVISQKYKKHLKFMKSLFGVHSKSLNAGDRGELGKYPLLINCLKLKIKYWLPKMPLNSIIINITWKI